MVSVVRELKYDRGVRRTFGRLGYTVILPPTLVSDHLVELTLHLHLLNLILAFCKDVLAFDFGKAE